MINNFLLNLIYKHQNSLKAFTDFSTYHHNRTLLKFTNTNFNFKQLKEIQLGSFEKHYIKQFISKAPQIEYIYIRNPDCSYLMDIFTKWQGLKFVYFDKINVAFNLFAIYMKYALQKLQTTQAIKIGFYVQEYMGHKCLKDAINLVKELCQYIKCTMFTVFVEYKCLCHKKQDQCKINAILNQESKGNYFYDSNNQSSKCTYFICNNLNEGYIPKFSVDFFNNRKHI